MAPPPVETMRETKTSFAMRCCGRGVVASGSAAAHPSESALAPK